jgi:hypothetical protein
MNLQYEMLPGESDDLPGNILPDDGRPSKAGDDDENTDTSALHFAGSTLQTADEFIKDKGGDHTRDDDKVTAGGVDDLGSNSDGAAGTDRAGTTERKQYGDTELNKGLESQAKDEEGTTV